MRIVLHNYRRCPFCIRTRIVLHLLNITYETVEEPLRIWTLWMRTHITHPSVPILRIISDESVESIMRESNDINLYLDQMYGGSSLTPSKTSESYQEMLGWWRWCDNELKPQIDVFKYGKDRHFDPQEHINDTLVLRDILTVLERHLIDKDFLVNDSLTLADIAIIPFIRQIMRTREGEFDFADFPHIVTWSHHILKAPWFDNVVMAKIPSKK